MTYTIDTIQSSPSLDNMTSRTIYVPSSTAQRAALAALRAELGGTWAHGVGNTYPEDYTVHDTTRCTLTIWTGPTADRRVVARIVIDATREPGTWTNRPVETCPRGHDAIEGQPVGDRYRFACRRCDYDVTSYRNAEGRRRLAPTLTCSHCGATAHGADGRCCSLVKVAGTWAAIRTVAGECVECGNTIRVPHDARDREGICDRCYARLMNRPIPPALAR